MKELPTPNPLRRTNSQMGRGALGVGGWLVLLVLGVYCGASAQTVSWPSEAPPPPLAARQVNFPPYEIRTLANGMQIITIAHHEQPAVTMRLLVRAGAAQDPERKGGVAYLTSHVLDQGTTTKSAQEIAEQIDLIGGSLGTGSGADLSFANVVVMKDSFGFGMALLSDVVHNPAFSPQEIERQKEQAISSLRVNSEDPDYLASAVFDRLVYGFHPYGLPGSGTPDTLASVTREDLQAFHRRYYVPNNMILAIVGDVTADEAFATAEKVFGSWPKVEAPVPNAVDPPQPTRRVVIIDKPDSVQTEIRVGQLAIPRKHPDFLAWDLAVKILGGEGANRLHQVLRSQRGLTYGASADTEAMKQAGDFVAETDTRTETTGEALRLMVDEFSRLQRERVRSGELADAQAYLAGSFPLTIETPNEIATQVLNAVFYDLPMQDIVNFRERVLAITPDDVQRVARQYIKPDRLAIVLVGNARAFIPQLQSVGFTDYEVIPIEQLDLMSATLKREQRRAATFGSFGSFGALGVGPNAPAFSRTQVNPRAGQPPVPQAQNDRAALDLLRRVVDAKGGIAALQAVRSVIADADTTLQMPQGTLASSTRTYVMYPDRFRVDATVAGAQVVQIYAGGNAWVKDPNGVHDAPPAMRADFAASVKRDTIPVLLGATRGEYTVRLLPEEIRNGARASRVLEFTGGGLALKLYIDEQDLIAKQAFTTVGADGMSLEVEEVFSDYRTINGVRVPFEAQLMHNGQAIMKRTLRSVAFNGQVAETLFARPQ